MDIDFEESIVGWALISDQYHEASEAIRDAVMLKYVSVSEFVADEEHIKCVIKGALPEEERLYLEQVDIRFAKGKGTDRKRKSIHQKIGRWYQRLGVCVYGEANFTTPKKKISSQKAESEKSGESTNSAGSSI